MKKALDEYECRHGMGYTIISSRYNDISCEILYFVPLEANCEIHQIKIKTKAIESENLNCFLSLNFVCGMLLMI